MNLLNERPLVVGLIAGLVVGVLIGWLAIGWWLWPIAWVDANPTLLREDFRADYVKMTADQYGRNLDQDLAKARMNEWPDRTQYICQLANDAPEGGEERQSLLDLAKLLSPEVDCVEIAAQPAEQAPSDSQSLGSRIALLCGVGLLAVVAVGAIFYFFYKRGAPKAVEDSFAAAEPPAPISSTDTRPIPLAQFPTEFNIGHDTYDDSFSIETSAGEFLGECGVGISESIGVGGPKKVTAFEIWLFDKNDIRTITKVIMSDHAYRDDALRAKLAPKGEAVLSKPGTMIVLETASLIINARIIEMEYGVGELPPQSFFNRLVVELAAWAKEGAEPADSDASSPDADEFNL